MCMHQSKNKPPKLQCDRSFHSEKTETLKPSVLQTTTSIAVILSTVAYLRKCGSENALGAGDEPCLIQSLLPYLLIPAFLFNVRRNLVVSVVERVQRLVTQWKNSMIPSNLSPKPLKSFSNVSSSEALSRLSRVSSTDTIRMLSKSIRSSWSSFRRRVALQAITRKECFARLDYIEQLSIADLIVLFRYATDVNQVDFDKKRFMAEQSQLLRAMVTAIDMAITISRGSLSEGAKFAGTRREGDVDALHFVAAVRIFAEWRTLRLLPNGYKRYSVALGLAYRDVLQNLAKIESGVHSYLKHCEALQADNIKPIPSPTLRQVLQHEINTNVHNNLPYLKEKSAASGLLWTKRQMHYQTATFSNSLEAPLRFPTPKDAASAAYKEVYDQFHGWTVKQVFTHSFGGSPPMEKIWKAMDPPQRLPVYKPKTSHDAQSDDKYRNFPQRKLSDVSEEDEAPENEFVMALEDFGKHIVGKWDEFLGLFNCVSDDERRHRSRDLILSSESYLNLNGVGGSAIDILESDPPQMKEDLSPDDPIGKVKKGTADFVKEMQPLLRDLSGLVDEFNMNDPTKV